MKTACKHEKLQINNFGRHDNIMCLDCFQYWHPLKVIGFNEKRYKKSFLKGKFVQNELWDKRINQIKAVTWIDKEVDRAK